MSKSLNRPRTLRKIDNFFVLKKRIRFISKKLLVRCFFSVLSGFFRNEKSKLWGMDSLHLICPHCGLKMEVVVKGKPSSVMIFVCARCKEPLMRYEGEVFELDREEFGMLRKKLAPVIAKLMAENHIPAPMTISSTLTLSPSNPPQEKKPTFISEDSLRELAKNLDECGDVAEFIAKM